MTSWPARGVEKREILAVFREKTGWLQAARMSLVGGALLSYRTTNQVARLGWGT